MPEENIFDGIVQTLILPATTAKNNYKSKHQKQTFMLFFIFFGDIFVVLQRTEFKERGFT